MAEERSASQILLERRRGHLVKLPSGLEVRVKYLNLSAFLTRGNIPNLLLPLVVEMINSGGIEKLVDRLKTKVESDLASAVEDIKTYGELTDFILRDFIAYPKVVESPALDNPDEMSLVELDPEDKAWLMSLVALPARQLETFCAASNALVESVSGREDPAPAPVEAVEPGGDDSAVDRDPGDRPVDPVPVRHRM